MNKERWERLKQIFGEALELEPAGRESFVRESVKDDPELLSELLRYLAENERDSGLLSQPVLAGARAPHLDSPHFEPSTVLARRFRVVRFIARGGMGEVYEAEDLELGVRVALKAIRQRVALDSELRALFKREVQLARRVTHPNVCRIFDLATHEDAQNGGSTLLLSMELIEGRTLAEHLRLNGPMSAREAQPLIEDIAAGLQAVHDAGVVHGDLKPGNVMLVSRPGEASTRAVVMDFGMALPVAAGPSPVSSSAAPGPSPDPGDPGSPTVTFVAPGWVLRGGTPEYFAPEQEAGGPASTATDIYALALVIADMLGMPRPLRLKPESERMPSRWVRVLRRSLENDPGQRYARPSDVAHALRRTRGTRAVVGIAAATVVIAAAILAVASMNREETPSGTANRRLFTEGDLQAWSPSPDGRSVAATSWDTGDLVLRDVTTGKIRNITHKPAAKGGQYDAARKAIFSPDGRYVAYSRFYSRTDSELRLIGVDGRGDRSLYRDPDGYAGAEDWSSDGKQILVRIFRNDTSDHFALLSVADGSLTFPRISGNARFSRVMFAEDGNSLLADGTGDIRRLYLDGRESTTLLGRPGSNSLIGWSPDRRRLIFFSNRKGALGIWAVDVSNGSAGEPQELSPNVGEWVPIGITRTGSFLYRSEADTVDVYTAVLDLAAGRTISPPRPVMDEYTGTYAQPNWSDDGRLLVFDSRHDPRHPAVAIYEADTGFKRELVIDVARLSRPQWIQHGGAIMAVGLGRDGVDGQYRIDPTTGKAQLFMSRKDLETVSEGVWSPDSRVYFNRFMNWKRGIFRLDVATRERKVIYAPPPGIDLGTENLALSPDGRTLAFHARNDEAKTGALMLLPVEGGEAKALLTVTLPEKFLLGSFTWTPDSRKILAARTKGDVTEIWQVPVDGSPPTRIEFPAMRMLSLRLNRDGKTIAFTKLAWRSEIWSLQNFL